jgi:hypothetical protein
VTESLLVVEKRECGSGCGEDHPFPLFTGYQQAAAGNQ